MILVQVVSICIIFTVGWVYKQAMSFEATVCILNKKMLIFYIIYKTVKLTYWTYHALLFYLSISAFYLEQTSCAPSTASATELPQLRGTPQSGAQLRSHSCPHNISRVHLCRSESRIVIIECNSRTVEREVLFILIHSLLGFSVNNRGNLFESVIWMK